MFFIFLNFSINGITYFLDWEIVNINSCFLGMNIYIDWMSAAFIRFVLFISSFIVIYRISYIHLEKNKNVFIVIVFMFVVSMLLLIVSPNLIRVLLGWDGLGLISYCLVIYYQNEKSYRAGMVTVLTNRIGDVIILMRIAWIVCYGGWNYIYDFSYDFYINFIIILAAITKRAQIPFSSWLPAAIAAPTPVSALVHSSTLVTAGLYLIIRFNNLLLNKSLSIFLLLLSVLTMFIAGLGANYEYDLKKIIALRTLSQLGLIVRCLSLGLVKLRFFHLLTHALFKSMLFICAGYMIHIILDSQDIRFIGCLTNQVPILGIIFVVSNLALCGIPFLSGFYSKDLILEMFSFINFNWLIYIIYYVSTILTVCYTFRLIFFSMMGSLKGFSFSSINDQDMYILFVLMIIIITVVVGGSLISWLLFRTIIGIYISFLMKVITLFVVVSGCFLGIAFGLVDSHSSFIFKTWRNFLGQMWYLPYLRTYCLNNSILILGYFYYKYIDQGVIEFLGPQGIKLSLVNVRKNRIKLLSNLLNVYLFMYMYILFLLIIFFFIFYLNSLYRAWYWSCQGNFCF